MGVIPEHDHDDQIPLSRLWSIQGFGSNRKLPTAWAVDIRKGKRRGQPDPTTVQKLPVLPARRFHVEPDLVDGKKKPG